MRTKMMKIFHANLEVDILTQAPGADNGQGADLTLAGDQAAQQLASALQSRDRGRLTVKLADLPTVDAALEALKPHFRLIEAAGGLVLNAHNELLMIHRRGRWDLPKGKIDPGESVETAAVREVAEETGLAGANLGAAYRNTYHIYQIKSEWVLKPTYWFEMSIEGRPELTPQEEEDITACEWVPLNQVPYRLMKSYSSLQWLLEGWLKQQGVTVPTLK
ncbi:MAG: NUDIX hydrolase [Bacteroidota bacterium]